MAYVTLGVMIAVSMLAVFLGLKLIRILVEARRARRNYRETVEGLAQRAHHAAKADRERARDSSEVAEATEMLARQAREVQDALTLERKLRKAIRATALPLEPASAYRKKENSPSTGASA